MTRDELIDFLYDPDTVDFVVRESDFFREFIKDRPEIITTMTLAGRYTITYIDRLYINRLFDDLGASFKAAIPLVCGLLDRASLDAAGIIQVQQQPFLDLRGSGVIVGIVDTGIDYTQKAFQYEDGTSKILYIFDQSIRGTPPEGFLLGEEYTKEEIDIALKSENPFQIVPSTDTVGHGTFLASIAAGREDPENPDFIGAAPDSELIVVKLKTARPFTRENFLIPPEQENAFESSAIMVGVEYIVRKAQQLNRPVAICLGLGTNSGGHDGFTFFEEYLSLIATQSGVCLCSAAGNEVEARHHTQVVLEESGDVKIIEVSVGENAGSIYMNMYNDASDRISVAVRSPTGELVGRFPAKSATFYESKLVLERSTVIVSYFFPLEGSGAQVTNIRIIDATPGVWQIIVNGDIVLDGIVHTWLPITGFVSPNVEFINPMPNYTVVTPSTAIGVITCGAYNAITNSLYPRRSWGPTRLPMMSPDFVAPGVNVGGVYPTGYGTMDGTSVSAAIATGACALLLQWGVVEGNEPNMSTFQARAYIIRGCSREENLTYPNTQWGYGKLNLINTFNLMREQ